MDGWISSGWTQLNKRVDGNFTILIILQRLPNKFRIQFKILVISYRALHVHAPTYIRDLLQPCVTSRSLWSSDEGLPVVPQSGLKTNRDCAFEVMPLNFWTSSFLLYFMSVLCCVFALFPLWITSSHFYWNVDKVSYFLFLSVSNKTHNCIECGGNGHWGIQCVLCTEKECM